MIRIPGTSISAASSATCSARSWITASTPPTSTRSARSSAASATKTRKRISGSDRLPRTLEAEGVRALTGAFPAFFRRKRGKELCDFYREVARFVVRPLRFLYRHGSLTAPPRLGSIAVSKRVRFAWRSVMPRKHCIHAVSSESAKRLVFPLSKR